MVKTWGKIQPNLEFCQKGRKECPKKVKKFKNEEFQKIGNWKNFPPKRNGNNKKRKEVMK